MFLVGISPTHSTKGLDEHEEIPTIYVMNGNEKERN
jgi:hypothetical protein